jgi:dihydropyrimidinase
LELELIIRNALVATASDRFTCDIGISDGRIVVLAKELSGSSATPTFDATGLLTLPGGVDVHCHIDEPEFGGAVLADDFESASLAAVCGGTTTMVSFANQIVGATLRDAVSDYHQRAHGKSYIDYGFHIILRDPNDHVLRQELPALLSDGYTSFKVFMTYEGFRLDDRQVLDVLEVAKAHSGLVMIHAENDHCICWMSDKLKRAGHVAPHYFGVAHGEVAEREATHRAISLAEVAGSPIYIVHVSSRQAMDQIVWARQRRMPVVSETCPQYLTLSDEYLAREGWEGAKFICAPPPRVRSNAATLWNGIETGAFDVISSDHCPYRMEGVGGRKSAAGAMQFDLVAPGLPGIETRLPLIFSEGVSAGRIGVHRFVDLVATTPAKMFGMYPKKGTIAVGSDADISFWDPRAAVVISHRHMHDRSDYSPYEGMKVTGWPVVTMVRGEIVWQEGKVLRGPGRGGFLKRGISSVISEKRESSRVTSHA